MMRMRWLLPLVIALGCGRGGKPSALSAEGSTFQVEIRGRPVGARVVKTPFYKR